VPHADLYRVGAAQGLAASDGGTCSDSGTCAIVGVDELQTARGPANLHEINLRELRCAVRCDNGRDASPFLWFAWLPEGIDHSRPKRLRSLPRRRDISMRPVNRLQHIPAAAVRAHQLPHAAVVEGEVAKTQSVRPEGGHVAAIFVPTHRGKYLHARTNQQARGDHHDEDAFSHQPPLTLPPLTSHPQPRKVAHREICTTSSR